MCTSMPVCRNVSLTFSSLSCSMSEPFYGSSDIAIFLNRLCKQFNGLGILDTLSFGRWKSKLSCSCLVGASGTVPFPYS